MYLLGLNCLIFIPAFGDVKIFDLIAVLIFFIKFKNGFIFLKNDYLFIIFIIFSILSLGFANYSFESSFLQTVRYLFYFLIARINYTQNDTLNFISGIKSIFFISFFWILIDVLQYYTIGNCISMNERYFTWVEYMPTHRYSIPVWSCYWYRPSGLSWDPGGFYPFALILAAAINDKKFLNYYGFLSVLSFSRTGIIAYISGKLNIYFSINSIIYFLFIFIVLPEFFLFFISNIQLIGDFSDGTLRHLTYPAVAIELIFENFRYFLFGNGLRSGGSAFLKSSYDYISDFINMGFDESIKNFVVESIWVNLLLGVGVIGFISYLTWLFSGFRLIKTSLIILITAGVFYTFDSSQFCFMTAYLMVLRSNIKNDIS